MSSESRATSGMQSEGLGLLFILMLSVAGLFAAYWFFATQGIPAKDGDWSSRGQFGDMFGAFNALFSALAFCGIIYTVHLQRKELTLQRQELMETRMELARSAKAQEEAQHALKKQLEVMRDSSQVAALDTLVRSLDTDLQLLDGHKYSASRQSKDYEIRTRRIKLLAKLEEKLTSTSPN